MTLTNEMMSIIIFLVAIYGAVMTFLNFRRVDKTRGEDKIFELQKLVAENTIHLQHLMGMVETHERRLQTLENRK